MTDAETKLYISECVQAEQTKLSASHARISTDIATLREEFKSLVDDSRKTQAATMQGYIREAISANTLSLTNADTSPFITKTEMVTLFAEFKSELRTIFHPAPILNAAHPPPYDPYG
jgi:hypothetical protein